MNICFTKLDPQYHEIRIERADGSGEKAVLDTKTYFLHDICHYCAEQYLGLTKGFWGMIAQGYAMSQLKGKDNPLTEELRQIEHIVGGTQSLYSGHMPLDLFEEAMKTMLPGTDWSAYVNAVIPQIKQLLQDWKFLPNGRKLELSFLAVSN